MTRLKRPLDIAGAIVGLILGAPLIAVAMLLVWAQDRGPPLYAAPRIGRGGHPFSMVKLRTMVLHADRIGGTSTAGDDRRITPLGHALRRFKLDELPQLWNVLVGDMSLVGPRPQAPRDVDAYDLAERRLLTARPGVTDFSSIVFADESEILRGHADPDTAYDRIIRPWKSRLGLFYIDHASLAVDLSIIAATLAALVSRPAALGRVQRMLAALGAPADLVAIAARREATTQGLDPTAEGRR